MGLEYFDEDDVESSDDYKSSDYISNDATDSEDFEVMENNKRLLDEWESYEGLDQQPF